MSPTIRLMLLANSAKHHERCLAGIDLATGNWIRPVTNRDSGSVPISRTILNGMPLKPLDIIELELTQRASLPWQRENWLFEPETLRRVRSIDLNDSFETLRQISEQNASFVTSSPSPIEHDYYSDVIFDYPSLALLEVQEFRIIPTINDHKQKRNRLHFQHSSKIWDLSLTDVRYPAWISGETETKDTQGGKAFICLSIGENYQAMNRHYRIAAGLISKSIKQ